MTDRDDVAALLRRGGVVAVVGSRDGVDEQALCDRLSAMLAIARPRAVVSGGARGVDTIARRTAERLGIRVQEFLPDYERHGRAAPLVRNGQIAEACTEMWAFWDGRSRGTHDAIVKAARLGRLVAIMPPRIAT
jgi:predicted Rossmann-fold nucleotide-binding protein